jgi:hypothetical protein
MLKLATSGGKDSRSWCEEDERGETMRAKRPVSCIRRPTATSAVSVVARDDMPGPGGD